MRLFRLAGRALARRCPSCGGPGIFESYFRLREHCPTCRIGLTAVLAVVIATWPNPPWDLVLYGGVGVMIAAPIGLYPVAKALFLALDLTFRPNGQ